MDELLIVADYGNRLEADLAVNLLESHGIPCAIQADDCGGVAPAQSLIQRVKIFVNAKDTDQALEILGKESAGDS